MEIQDLIKKFEQECLFGSDRTKNFILYDRLLDKIDNEENIHWNLNYARSYLSIVWYRLKKENLGVTVRYFNDNESREKELEEGEKPNIFVEPYGLNEDGNYVIIFNTNLRDKYAKSIYCLAIKGKVPSALNKYPFYTWEDLNFLSVNEAIDCELRKSMQHVMNRIKNVWGGEMPSIRLKIENFSAPDRCTIRVNELSELEFDRNKIEPSLKERENRLKVFCPKGVNRYRFFKQKIKGDASNKESKLLGWDHIVVDGSDSLSLQLINTILSDMGKKYYYTDKFAIQQDVMNRDVYNCLKELIRRAIYRSSELIYKKHYIAPIYHIENNTISYVLPLYIYQRKKPDCALIFNYDNDSKQYVGKTLLNMDEVRIDARICGEIDDYKWMF